MNSDFRSITPFTSAKGHASLPDNKTDGQVKICSLFNTLFIYCESKEILLGIHIFVTLHRIHLRAELRSHISIRSSIKYVTHRWNMSNNVYQTPYSLPLMGSTAFYTVLCWSGQQGSPRTNHNQKGPRTEIHHILRSHRTASIEVAILVVTVSPPK